jgi:hypothetical protein
VKCEQATTTARAGGATVYIPTHRDVAAMDGAHPIGCGCVKEEQATAKAGGEKGVLSPTIARSGGLRMGHPRFCGFD